MTLRSTLQFVFIIFNYHANILINSHIEFFIFCKYPYLRRHKEDPSLQWRTAPRVQSPGPEYAESALEQEPSHQE
jgi:hypothetical protein